MDALSCDCLRLVLAKIADPVCLASVSCVCKEWRTRSAEQWPLRTKQWRFGWMGRWETLCAMGLYLQVFGERWQVDKQALACVKVLSLPCEREKALAWLRGTSHACLDVLLAAAYRPPSDNPNLREALAAIQTVWAADELQGLMASNDRDLDRLERALLCIAQTYAPEKDVSAFVLPFLDTLAREAYSRMCSRDGCTNHQVHPIP
ncbi:hypothetical protein DUNSADRAFT_5132 [Dunaliella salina]|uniref:F-box domain-containing protein n=1 Tax=Dunaliella salina TaxID=3046 RepID=A0ABQ7H7C6_DUNSA|nr:hypothetical protein DUNSADRAFT_5132 [Dunaliella salina]|eukprot:KAF5842760.1 hypothetical protein DUNSADRAFT_5132 [Dunaliella salina]